MKPRKWIILVGLCACVLLGTFFFVKRSLKKNRNIEQLLVQYVAPLVGGAFDVENIDIGIFSVHLSGVKVAIPLKSFQINVTNIKIGFSLFEFIRTRGDVTRSIDKVIFVDPTIEFAFSNLDAITDTSTTTGQSSSFTPVPIKDILIQNCRIFLNAGQQERTALGEGLTGRLYGRDGAILFDLTGRFGSVKKNVFLSGEFDTQKKQQHLSIRLAKAHIKKPIQFNTLTLNNGVLDGVCEFFFTDTTFPENIEAHGAITVDEGVASLFSIDSAIHDITMQCSLKEDRVAIDTLFAAWQGASITGKGDVAFSQKQPSSCYVRIDGMDISQLSKQSERQSSVVSGVGWVEVFGNNRNRNHEFVTDIVVSGFTAFGSPFNTIAGRCRIGMTQTVVDTLFVKHRQFRAGASGVLNYAKTPITYSFTIDGESDLSSIRDDFSGTASINGSIRGLDEKYTTNMTIRGDSLSLYRIPCGNPTFTLKNIGSKISILSEKSSNSTLLLSGEIDSLTSETPQCDLSFSIAPSVIRQFISGMSDKKKIVLDSVDFSGTLKGPLMTPNIRGRVFAQSGLFKGGAQIELDTRADNKPFLWRVRSQNVSVADSAYFFMAHGLLQHDTLTISSCTFLDTVQCSGIILLGDSGALDLSGVFQSVSLKALNQFAFNGTPVVENGILQGTFRLQGPIQSPKSTMQFSLRQGSFSGISSLNTDVVCHGTGSQFTVSPFVIRKDKRILISIDTISNSGHLTLSGSFKEVAIGELLKKGIEEDFTLSGLVSGKFSTASTGFPISISMFSKEIVFNSWKLDSVTAGLSITEKGVSIDTLLASDSTRSTCIAKGVVPWPFFNNSEEDHDTLRGSLKVSGDLLASLERHYYSPVGGHGKGSINIQFFVAADEWHFEEAEASIPSGLMTINPFVPDHAKEVSFSASMDDSSKLHFDLRGRINRKPVRIFSSHDVPKGFESITIGNIDCGVIAVSTPKNGIHIFMPGFMERGTVVEVDFAPIAPFKQFALSGPMERLKINGTWIIHNTEFTFPFLEDEPPPMEEDPFPYITWNLNVKAGNRNVIYYFNVGAKKRRLIRFVECYVDPSHTIKIRGREYDGTFKLYGSLASYRGYAFYGKTFNRNFKLELDFFPIKNDMGPGFNNMPIIEGSAEAFSDSSRYDRITLTVLTRDSLTGVLRERGRFKDIAFRVSSDYEEIPGESEKDFYREAGLNFITLKGAGEIVSDFGDQYLQRYLLQRLERKLARRVGLDVISFETSIASNYFNYFYNNRDNFDDLSEQWGYLAFANVGLTLGRYFFRDKWFLKWRTELIPRDMILNPEHNIGLEYQPMEYFWMDFNYGFYRYENLFQSNPKVRMQLRVPIGKFRDAMNF